VTDRRISSDLLSRDDLPDPSRGWDRRAVEFAHTFDGYAHIGGTPQELERRLVAPLRDSLRRAGRVPHAYTVDDLRAVLFWIARADHFTDWSREPGGDEFRLYVAAVDRIRHLLTRRSAGGRSTAAGSRHRCPWCGSRWVARILYGLPAFTDDVATQLDVGEVSLGGCMVSPDQAEFRCNACGHGFRRDWAPGVATEPPGAEGER
jgi:hypothetical protein